MKFEEIVKYCKAHEYCSSCPAKLDCNNLSSVLASINPVVLAEIGIKPDLVIEDGAIYMEGNRYE